MIYVDWSSSAVTKLDKDTKDIINLITDNNFTKAGIDDILSFGSSIGSGWFYNVYSILIAYLILILSFLIGLYVPPLSFILFSVFVLITYLTKPTLLMNILLHAGVIGISASYGAFSGSIVLGLVILARLFIDIPLLRKLNTFLEQNNYLSSIFLFGKFEPMKNTKELEFCVDALKNKFELPKEIIVYAYFSGVHNSKKEETKKETVKFIERIYKKL